MISDRAIISCIGNFDGEKMVYISDIGNFVVVLVDFIKLCCKIKLFAYNNSRE